MDHLFVIVSIIEYVSTFLMIHLVIIIPLAVPFILFVVPAIKKKKKYCFLLPCLLLFCRICRTRAERFWDIKLRTSAG